MKIHMAKVVQRRDHTRTTTLCGRSNKRSMDGFNSTGEASEVTCKFCLERMAVQRLHDAIQEAPSLPRCPHGNCLKDGSGERLEPSCGCRITATVLEFEGEHYEMQP